MATLQTLWNYLQFLHRLIFWQPKARESLNPNAPQDTQMYMIGLKGDLTTGRATLTKSP